MFLRLEGMSSTDGEKFSNRNLILEKGIVAEKCISSPSNGTDKKKKKEDNRQSAFTQDAD